MYEVHHNTCHKAGKHSKLEIAIPAHICGQVQALREESNYKCLMLEYPSIFASLSNIVVPGHTHNPTKTFFCDTICHPGDFWL